MKVRVEKNKNYTVMSNYHLRDMNLTLKARGLLSCMLSLPDNWDYTIEGLAHICKDGVGAIRTALIELEKEGYLVREQDRTDGRFSKISYVIYEDPIKNNIFPHVAKKHDKEPCNKKEQYSKEKNNEKKENDTTEKIEKQKPFQTVKEEKRPANVKSPSASESKKPYPDKNVKNNKSPVPTKEDCLAYKKKHNLNLVDIDSFYDYYSAQYWKDNYGYYLNWGQKMVSWNNREKKQNTFCDKAKNNSVSLFYDYEQRSMSDMDADELERMLIDRNFAERTSG